jgi:hypothetical protein
MARPFTAGTTTIGTISVVVVVEDVSVDVVPEVSGAGSSAKASVALANERPAQAISESTSLRSMFPSVLTSHYDA